MPNETANLGLPLDLNGHVATEEAIKDGFKKVDAAIGGSGTVAGATGTDVYAILTDLAARVTTLEGV